MNAPVFGAVEPIGGGDANDAVTPAPTMVSAVSVVNVPARFVVAPIVMLSIVPAVPLEVGCVKGKTESPFDVKNVVFPASAARVAANKAPATGRMSFLILIMAVVPVLVWSGFNFVLDAV